MPRAPRYLAFDDGAFRRGDPEVPIAGVMTRGAGPVEAIVVDRVTVDGWDATDRVLACARRLPGAGPDVVLIDGVALGGLNLVDLGHLAATIGRPVAAVTRRRPDPEAMRRAAERTPEPERRVAMLPRDPAHAVALGAVRLHVQARSPDGGTLDAAALAALLGPAMGAAALPEPLRLAHLVASAITRGVSGTRA